MRHLHELNACVGDDESLDWNEYRSRFAATRIPDVPVTSPRAFSADLLDSVEGLLASSGVTLRAVEIFRLRTCRERGSRLTLAATAVKLGTWGSAVKREESILLKFLFEVLVERDFSAVPVWLDSEWLERWREAYSVFGRSRKGYESFKLELQREWCLAEDQAGEAVATIWAVFTGYPDRRRSAFPLSDSVAAAPTGTEYVRIQLRGFRRKH